jgi:uncharacterized phage infection (PIP) family protein YhgE
VKKQGFGDISPAGVVLAKLPEDLYLHNITSAMEFEKNKYDAKITQIKQIFLSALEEFKDAYVLHKENPEDEDYQNSYQTAKIQLQNLILQMASLRTNIKSDINNIRKNAMDLSNNANLDKGNIQKMNEIITSLNDTNMGAKTFANDLSSLTSEQRNENRALFMGIIVVGIVIMFFHKL